VGAMLATQYAVCSVRGDVSGFARAPSGHCYFNLKDADGDAALLRCVMFRRAAGLLAFAPADGQLVDLRGRLGVYEPRGELQLVVESMQPAGAGARYEQFLLTKARLETQGLFSADRKRSVPRYPRAVGIVTSLGSAALHDALTALARRAPHVTVTLYPSPVQGVDAPAALVEAIDAAARHGHVDVLIVCRGGGSLEDLWAFNDERVVRAIVAAAMPVICGVGHETDVTLADFAADLRAPTPTAAAELAAPVRDDCLDGLASISQALRRTLDDRLDAHAQRLDRAALRLARPGQGVHAQARRLALLAQRLAGQGARATERRRLDLTRAQEEMRQRAARLLADRAAQLDRLSARLQSLNPRQVLSRGFAWLADANGCALMTVRGLSAGADVHAVLADGSVDLRVTAVRPGAEV
jgi:exodeoxyribonuclease VII large subunit